jgi:signal transduction histidine kinase
VLVIGAIRVSGGRESVSEMMEVLVLSGVGTVMNTLLALSGAVILAEEARMAWLGLAAPLLLFIAYDAYTGQRSERGRLASLFEATKTLHGRPRVEDAVDVAAELALDLVKAESAHVVLFGAAGEHSLSSVGRDRRTLMEPVSFDPMAGPWSRLARLSRPRIFPAGSLALAGTEITAAREMIVARLGGENETRGLLIVCDRLGDVASFGEEDTGMLATLASQLSVSLENGRLTDNLAEVRRLQSQLEELVRSKDQLIASVSHELRTPLTGVVGLAQVLQEVLHDGCDPEAAEMVGMIVSQGVELSNIIDDLLVQAKAENGTLQVFPSRVDVVNELRAVVATSAIPATTVHDSTSVPHAWADPLRLRQVVRNLLTNATRYGGPSVRIEVDASATEVAVRVRDDGGGVPADLQDTIFLPYQTAHVRSTQPGSVGLGLPVSRSIARCMGGDLTYRRIGTETVFTLTLPIAG